MGRQEEQTSVVYRTIDSRSVQNQTMIFSRGAMRGMEAEYQCRNSVIDTTVKKLDSRNKKK